MYIYFPFFAGSKGLGLYYCGVVKYEGGKLSLLVNGSQQAENLIYTPFSSPDPEILSIEFLDKCIEECKRKKPGTNAVIVKHYIIETSSLTHQVFNNILISYERKESSSSGKLYLNYVYGVGKDNEEYHIFVISGSSSKAINSVVIRDTEIKEKEIKVKDSQSIELKKIKTWALTTHVPIKITMNNANTIVKHARINLLEALMGSIVFVVEKERRKQLRVLIPTPLLSTLFFKQRGAGKEIGISLLALPSASRIDVGGIIIEMNLKKLYNKLVFYLIKKLNATKKLLEELHKKKPLTCINFIPCGEESLVSTYDDQEKELDVYSEAILKALVNNLIIANISRLVTGFHPRNEHERNLLRDRLRLPHRLRRIDVPISSRDLGLRQLDTINISKDVYVAYEIVKNRTLYLKDLLTIFRELKKIASSNYDTTELLLASFIYLIDDRVQKLSVDTGRRYSLNVESCVLAYRIALLLLELGLHAISHLLLKYIYGATKVSRLKELVVLSVGRDYVNKGEIAEYYLNVLINGFMYRLISPRDDITGLIIVYDVKPYSHKRWESIYNGFNLKDFISFSLKYLGVSRDLDRCLKLWQNEANRLDNYITLYDRVLGGIRILSDFKNSFNELFGLGYPAGRNMVLPLLDVRPLTHDIIRHVINAAKGKISEDEVKQFLKPHIEALYTISVPFCFDGCYNCVVLDKGCNSNPLSKEWSVSKSMARLILQELEKKVGKGL
jgi:hypothetical protein